MRRTVGICSLLVLVVGCAPQNRLVDRPPPKVTAARPLKQTITNYLEETATTEAVERVEIRARVEGFLSYSEQLKPGDDVEGGFVLYQIEPALYEAKVASASADVLAQEARRSKALIEKERQERMRERDPGATSEVAVVSAQAEFKAAEAAVKQAEAQLAQAQIDLDYTKVASPISGRVGKSLVKENNLVGSAGDATVLTTVIKYDPIYANFNISERALLELTEKARIRAETEEPEDVKAEERKVPIYLARLVDKPGEFPFQGHFDYADLAVDQSTGTFMIRGIFPNPDRRIVPGLFVQVRLPIGKQEDALLIPEQALGSDQGGRYLLIVNDENKVKRRNVTVGEKVGEMVVIDEGLKGDERVIIEGLQRARLDAEVNPTEIELPPIAATEIIKSGGAEPPSPDDAGSLRGSSSPDAGAAGDTPDKNALPAANRTRAAGEAPAVQNTPAGGSPS